MSKCLWWNTWCSGYEGALPCLRRACGCCLHHLPWPRGCWRPLVVQVSRVVGCVICLPKWSMCSPPGRAGWAWLVAGGGGVWVGSAASLGSSFKVGSARSAACSVVCWKCSRAWSASFSNHWAVFWMPRVWFQVGALGWDSSRLIHVGGVGRSVCAVARIVLIM